MTRFRDLVVDFRALDPTTELLAENEGSGWARTRWGVIGLARLESVPETTAEARAALDGAVQEAYSLLDSLPETRLPAEDLWNLTLLVSVPWRREEAPHHPEAYESLVGSAQDTRGARKLILWADESVANHFGRLTTPTNVDGGVLTDPLREVIATMSRDTAERDALEILFKGKLTQDDIDELVRVLGRDGPP